MFICILATNENVEAVREKGKQIEKFVNHKILRTPLSETGEKPITHWFCWFQCSEEVKEQIFSLQDLSIVEMCHPVKFLEKHNLKKIDKNKDVK